jgi:hypothetical protein
VFKLFLLSLFSLVLMPSAFAACDVVNVEVVPFVYTHQDMPAKVMRKVGGSDTLVGMLRVGVSVTFGECSAHIEFKNAVLTIAEELKRSDCAYQHVLTHELEHVRIYTDASKTVGAQIEADVPKLGMQAAITKALDGINAQNEAHDNPYEYNSNMKACHGRVYALSGL